MSDKEDFCDPTKFTSITWRGRKYKTFAGLKKANRGSTFAFTMSFGSRTDGVMKRSWFIRAGRQSYALYSFTVDPDGRCTVSATISAAARPGFSIFAT